MPLRTESPVDRMVIDLYKFFVGKGVSHLYRSFGERVIVKDRVGWNRPILGKMYHRAKGTLDNGEYSGKRGTEILSRLLDSLFVIMDDDDVYFVIGLNLFTDMKDIVIPPDWRNQKGKGFVERDMDKDVIR